MRPALEIINNFMDFLIGRWLALVFDLIAQPSRKNIDNLVDDGLNFFRPKTSLRILVVRHVLSPQLLFKKRQ
jgi:hypothetical protein